VLDRALQAVAVVWKGSAVTVERRYEENLPLVPLDEDLSEQAFVNIIQNAYDAMSEGGGKLWVTVEKSRTGREGVEVRLQDTGPGVPVELREQIFNPFMTTKKTGVGLGLSIVSKIMDGHQGFIRVESGNGINGQGATFVLFFPASSDVAASREAIVIS
jgi:signal transduction histidine kinase